jgi:hypothetical protein
MDIDEVDDSSTSGSFRSSSGGLGSRSSSSISGSNSSSSSISSTSTSSGSMSTTTSSSKTKGRESEAEKLLDSLSTGDPTEDVDSGSLRDRRTASGRSTINIAPSWQSFDREGRSTRILFHHSTEINY